MDSCDSHGRRRNMVLDIYDAKSGMTKNISFFAVCFWYIGHKCDFENFFKFAHLFQF